MRKCIASIIMISVLLSGIQVFFIEPIDNPPIIRIEEINEEYSCQKKIASNQRNGFETEEEFGDQESFWVYNDEMGDYFRRTATLLAVGNLCYVYMDNRTIEEIGESEAITKCERLRDEFDAVIYPTGTQLAGNPDGRIGDIDGDPKVTILLLPMIYGGYYRFEDDDPTHPYSNLREMIYINSERDIIDIIKITAHEFNHLIWGNYEQDEAIFFSEGSADYALYHAGYLSNASYLTYEPGYNLSAETHSFALHPELSLLYWHFFDDELILADYGQAYMFMFYLAEKYGEEIITNLVSELSDGPRALDKLLAEAGCSITFDELYLNWIIACTIDEESFANGLYGFSNADFTMKKYNDIISSFPAERDNKKHYHYGFDIKKLFSPPDEFTFQITNPPYPYSLGISIAVHDQDGWNVTQTLHTSEDESIVELISGNSIDYAFVITSLMSSSSYLSFMRPGDYYAFDPYVLLNYSFIEGHFSPSESKEGGFEYTFFILFPVVFGFRILVTIFRKSEYKK